MSLVDMQIVCSIPASASASAATAKVGRWSFVQVGVNAPGTPKITVFLSPTNSRRLTGPGRPPAITVPFTSGSASPSAIGIVSPFHTWQHG